MLVARVCFVCGGGGCMFVYDGGICMFLFVVACACVVVCVRVCVATQSKVCGG